MHNPFSYNNLYVTQKSLTGHASARSLSPQIWSRLLGGNMSSDSLLNGYFVGDDFLTFGLTTAVAANVGRYASQGGAYLSYEDTGNAITQIATDVGGVMKIATDATDNDETWIQPGMATSVIGKIASGSGGKMMLFEARVKLSSITNSTLNTIIGMSEEGLAAADTVTDAGALASKDIVGFWVLEGDGDALKYGYRKAGQTEVTVGTYGTALVADTWYKVGFAFDPSPHISPSKRITFYVNNEEQTSYVAESALDDATFPDGEELNMLFGLKNGAAGAVNVSMDWWAAYCAG